MQNKARNPSFLQTLMAVGCPKQRALKAITATGGKSVQLASDWLIGRANDATLDQSTMREYVVYLTPTGPLNELNLQIYNFWYNVEEAVGRNVAQNVMPHITIFTYFQASDEHCAKLCDCLVSAARNALQCSPLCLPLMLERYVSNNYMGLFATAQSAKALHHFRRQFYQATQNFVNFGKDTNLEEEIHLTLAYSYTESQFPKINSLVKSVDENAAASWEICLYSREARFAGCQVFRAKCKQIPQSVSELSLSAGDYVFIRPEEGDALWKVGTSWLSGCSGSVNTSMLERVPESDTWTLHKCLTIGPDGSSLDVSEGVYTNIEKRLSLSTDGELRAKNSEGEETTCPSHQNLLLYSEGSRRKSKPLTINSDVCKTENPPQQIKLSQLFSISDKTKSEEMDVDSVQHSSVEKPPKRSSSLLPHFNFPIEGPRKLYVMRHGERSDFCFQDRWYRAFTGNPKDGGVYTATHLNMQFKLPRKKNGPYSHQFDPPLTRVGELQAQLVGEGFLATKTPLHHIYVSPALRCVMTATNVLKSLNLAHLLSLKVEPGLFEWHEWYKANGIPQFMTTEELLAAGHNVDTDYCPVMTVKELNKTESCEEYYMRNARVVNAILDSTKHMGGTMLLVAHGASLDTCTRHLFGGLLRNSHDMVKCVKQTPYCVVSAMTQDQTTGFWTLTEPPFLPPFHSGNNTNYNWRMWQ